MALFRVRSDEILADRFPDLINRPSICANLTSSLHEIILTCGRMLHFFVMRIDWILVDKKSLSQIMNQSGLRCCRV